jgi:BirA family biotin operon repressor/biotin-[acetyl-CoA-carboxylase] ligase
MKALILNALRHSAEPVSGSELCARLGTSRVAVWKHIQKLQAAGYAIAAGPKGYTLVSEADLLNPWEFLGREERVHCFAELPSTMDAAKELARQGCPAFTVVVAERQSAGRGRLRRPWESPAGGLYFTVVLRPEIPAPLSLRVNFLAAVTLARFLRRRFGVAAGLKWPNDILVDGRKLCGLLAEMESEGEAVHFVNVGMGVNVNNDVAGIAPPAVALKALLGREVPRRELLAGFLDDFEAAFARREWEAVIPEWKRLSVNLGRPVRIVTAGEEVRGVAEDVDESGALIVRQSDGARRAVIYGDCFIPPSGDPGPRTPPAVRRQAGRSGKEPE